MPAPSGVGCSDLLALPVRISLIVQPINHARHQEEQRKHGQHKPTNQNRWPLARTGEPKSATSADEWSDQKNNGDDCILPNASISNGGKLPITGLLDNVLH